MQEIHRLHFSRLINVCVTYLPTHHHVFMADGRRTYMAFWAPHANSDTASFSFFQGRDQPPLKFKNTHTKNSYKRWKCHLRLRFHNGLSKSPRNGGTRYKASPCAHPENPKIKSVLQRKTAQITQRNISLLAKAAHKREGKCPVKLKCNDHLGKKRRSRDHFVLNAWSKNIPCKINIPI